MAVKVGKYHLFQRRQDTGTFWYCWYEDDEGKRIQRACGHGCECKRDATLFIEELLRADLLEEKHRAELRKKTFSLFAEKMFLDGAPHLERWKAKGRILKPQTITQHRRHLVNYLIPKFGRLTLDKIRPAAVEDYLLEQRLSNSCRNTILYTLKQVMQEARREGIIEAIPDFEPFKRAGRRQDVLSGEELTALFPYDEQDLIEIWKRPDDMRKEQDEIALMFGTLFCVTVSAGLRSGEIRALHREQVSVPNSGLDKLGIDYEKRRLTVHCLRYTYNTRMRTLLSEQVLREFVGHRSIAMTDHYDNPILTERLIAYQEVRPSVERFWGKVE
jgi:integrase